MCLVKKTTTSFTDLSKELKENVRHSMCSFLSCLPTCISVLHVLDTEANIFYARNRPLYDAALLTSCFTQHAPRPLIDPEKKAFHKSSFYK